MHQQSRSRVHQNLCGITPQTPQSCLQHLSLLCVMLVLDWFSCFENHHAQVEPYLLPHPARHHFENKDLVAHLTPTSGHCQAFSPTIPPLLVALGFACSVASLSRCPSFQLPGQHHLHGGALADYKLGWGRASTCTTGHV